MLLGLELSVLSMFEGKYSNGKEFLLSLYPGACIAAIFYIEYSCN